MPVFDAGHDLALRRAVAPQLVGHEHARRIAQALQQFAEEPLGGFGIAPALHQDVEDVPFLIDCSPQIMNLAANADEHFIQMPFVARLRPTALQGRREHPAEAQTPFADAFVTDHDAARGQDQLDIAQAQAEAVIEPDRVLDDLSRKAKATIRVQRQVHDLKAAMAGRSRQPDNAAPLALYLSFLDGEGGAEGYAAAVTRDQARILFDTAREMVRRSPEIRRRYGVEPLANAIWQERTSSQFRPISSDAKALDGLNVQIAVCDEIASHKTSEVYDVLLTAMGKRRNPLLLAISTATGNNAGIGKQLWDYAVRVLEGVQADDRLFALIYPIDLEDDPWEEASWIKANPSWGQAVQPEAIRAIMRQARNNPAQEAAAKSRHLNIWVSADEALFSMRSWRECANSLA